MQRSSVHNPDPRLDLVLERVIDVPRELVWSAWTTPKHLKRWFCPAPWKAVECEIDLRPGGIFRTLMRGPEGESMPYVGCYLEVVPNERLVWTNSLAPGFRPAARTDEIPLFTAVIALASHAKGTKYTALVLHGNEADCRKHDQMGFREGWGKALDQLVAVARKM
jgi:uncharacterized protein YndB with AHSA1/START domain